MCKSVAAATYFRVFVLFRDARGSVDATACAELHAGEGAEITPGAHVEVQGLISASHLNGSRGVVEQQTDVPRPRGNPGCPSALQPTQKLKATFG